LEIHYSPEENLEQIDADLLASAEGEVELTAYSFTDRRIVKVLEERASKGVTIRIYSDHASTKEELSRARGEEAGILELARTPNIEVRVKRSSTPAHMKAYEVDGRVLRTGSSNFSASAEKRQDNDLLLLRNPASIGQYRAKFKEMWEREDNEVIQSGSEQPTD
jgi:phosphatidylserine/phosphatidylglycerophosphate/cardiolipin synthase-like enzyme